MPPGLKKVPNLPNRLAGIMVLGGLAGKQKGENEEGKRKNKHVEDQEKRLAYIIV